MSPEQAMGLSDVDARSDIYSLGAVAYYLLTGAVPFERATTMQVLTAHARDPVRPVRQVNADVPVDLEEVVLRCLEKEPDKRYQDAESLEQALAACGCAGRWTQQQARTWWEENDIPSDSRDSSETPQDTAPTVLASPVAAPAAHV
jgi:serine/threonine-protein kinase